MKKTLMDVIMEHIYRLLSEPLGFRCIYYIYFYTFEKSVMKKKQYLYWSPLKGQRSLWTTSPLLSSRGPQCVLQWPVVCFRWRCRLTLRSPPAQSCIFRGSSCHWSWSSRSSGPVACQRSSSARRGSPEDTQIYHRRKYINIQSRLGCKHQHSIL